LSQTSPTQQINIVSAPTMYPTSIHALLHPAPSEHNARRIGPEAKQRVSFPLLAGRGVGGLGEWSAIISPDHRCFRPDAADAGNANCANTACNSPSFDGQTGTGIHEGWLALACACVCVCGSACVRCVSETANWHISSARRRAMGI
jgi:hypothetical protein